MNEKHLIVRKYRATDEEWMEICKKSPFATFFHTPLWADIFCKASENRLHKASTVLVFDDGTKVLFPCVYKNHLRSFLKVALSMPASTYGGPVSEKQLHCGYDESLVAYLDTYRDLVFRENPYDPLLKLIDIKGSTVDYTQSIDLSGGYDEVINRAQYTHRKAVRKSLRMGVSVEQTEDTSLWHEYYQIYRDSISRWKQNNLFTGVEYHEGYFESFYSLSPSYRRLYVARVNGKVIAGVIGFYWNRYAVMWHGAGLSEFFNYRPNNLIYDYAILQACKDGYSWFDCNPGSGLDGVITFKKYLGAEFLRSRIVERKSPVRRIVNSVRKLMK